MRRIITLITASLLILSVADAYGHNRCEEDWKKKMMSEKVAFLTIEMDLSPEEAQTFWPVYNQLNSERDAAMEEIIKTFHAMKMAVEEGKSGAEIEKYLAKYITAQENLRSLDNASYDRYKAVLSVDKVAKLYLAEEKFRRHHIRNLHGGGKKPAHSGGQANK